MKKWLRTDGTKKGTPTGVDRDVSEVEGSKRGVNGREKRRQKRHEVQGCRDKEGPGEQVEGDKKVIAGTRGGGRREWTPIQVDR